MITTLSIILNFVYVKLDRLTAITDSTGSKMDLGYDKNGRVSIAQTKRGGIRVKRDKIFPIEKLCYFSIMF